jgi:hypothetical protein
MAWVWHPVNREEARQVHRLPNRPSGNGTMSKIAAALAAGAAALALIGSPLSHADPSNPDPSGYFKRLREDGFLVDGNESYLSNLARIVCDMENAGVADSDIGDYIAHRENMSQIHGYTLFLDASIFYCTQLHPQLVPFTPPSAPVVSLPPGYRDGD